MCPNCHGSGRSSQGGICPRCLGGGGMDPRKLHRNPRLRDIRKERIERTPYMNEQFQKEIAGLVESMDPEEFTLDWGNNEVRVVNPETGGAKGQKLARFDLLPWDVLWEVAEHYGRGANKYEERNWERGYMWSLSYAALMRHLIAFWQGEDIDPESESHHLDAVIFHAMALRRYTVSHPEFDDRPKKGYE